MQSSRYNIWTKSGDVAYVFNGASGALLRLSAADHRAILRFLSGAGSEGCRPEVLARLVEGMMLVPDGADEIELLRRRYQATRHQATSFALTIVTSLGCNFDCPYCFEAKHPSVMAEEVQLRVLGLLDEQLARGVESFSVTWFGGEPLAGKRSLLALSDAFIERCARAGAAYEASIVTNGYLLDEETCIQLRDRCVRNVQVCLDGPPRVHDVMRPLASGQGTFWRIVGNLHHAVRHLPVSVRVNLNTHNIGTAEELLRILADEGLSGRLTVHPAQILALDDGTPAPSASYRPRCLTSVEFARAELDFLAMARRYGFAAPSLPAPTGAPCTAVRANELVVGSEGELYKCWASVGNKAEAIGHIRDHPAINDRLSKWLDYDPFTDAECLGCIALPVCMGGCAHHAMDPRQRTNRCGTFRHTYQEQVVAFVDAVERDKAATGVATSSVHRAKLC